MELVDQIVMDEMSYTISGKGVDGIGKGKIRLSSAAHLMCMVDCSFTCILFSLPATLNQGRRGVLTGTSGVITLMNCSLKRNPDVDSLSFSFLSLPFVPSVSLTIHNCPFADLSFTGECIVESGYGAEIIIENSNFTSIRRESGNGSCMCVWTGIDEWNGMITVESCIFTDCHVESNERGGGATYFELRNGIEAEVIECGCTGCSAPYTTQAS